MKKYKFTLIGLTISLITYLGAIILELDLFENLAEFLWRFEDIELDEVAIPLFVFILFALLNLIDWHEKHKASIEKIKVYKAMVFSTHHILNNFLNQMFLFKVEADNTEGFPTETLDLYDQIIRETKAQIEELSNLDEISEAAIFKSVKSK